MACSENLEKVNVEFFQYRLKFPSITLKKIVKIDCAFLCLVKFLNIYACVFALKWRYVCVCIYTYTLSAGIVFKENCACSCLIYKLDSIFFQFEISAASVVIETANKNRLLNIMIGRNSEYWIQFS